MEGWIGKKTDDMPVYILHTADGGIAWDSVSIPGAEGNACYIEFESSQTGYAVSGYKAFKTADGGQSWSEFNLTDNLKYEPYFFDETTGFISSSDFVYKTTDGGANWTPSAMNDVLGPYQSIDFKNANDGAACAGNYTWVDGTVNSGTNWFFSYECGLFTECYAVSYHPNGTYYFTGTENYPFIRDALGNTHFEDEDEDVFEMMDIHWYDANRCYAVGGNGYVVITEDGGIVWKKLQLTGLFGLNPVNFGKVDGFNAIYVFGEKGQAFKYTCGSAGFSAITNGSQVQFTDQSVNAAYWSWDFGDGTTSTDQHPVHIYQSPGTYNVCLVAGTPCGDETICDTVAILATGLSEPSAVYTFCILPNITMESFTMNLSLSSPKEIRIELFDINGSWLSCLLDGVYSEGAHAINYAATDLPSGIYIVRLHTDDGIITRKLIKQ